MKPVDIVLSALTLCAVGMAVAAYRAWHPGPEVRESVSDSTTDVAVRPASLPVKSVTSTPEPAKWFSSGDKLPPGYKCAGGGGVVYRVIKRGGESVIQPLIVNGVPAHCGGGFVYRPGESLPPTARVIDEDTRRVRDE